MSSRLPRWAAYSAASAISLVSLLPHTAAAQAIAPTSTTPLCSFNLGFAALSEAMTPSLVGDCLENEAFNPTNGNVEQRTTHGLLYWRKSDNTSAFTDGNITWLNGPFGIQARLNADAPYDWEVIAPPPSATSADIQTTSNSGPAVSPPPAITTTGVTPVTSGPVNLRNGDLTSADRRGADLVNADFFHAKLIGTDFTGANLTGASLVEADVSRAVFAQADLTRAQLTSLTSNGSKTAPGASFFQAHLNAANLAQAKLPFADFRQADLHNVDLSRANLSGADLRGADLRYSDLSQANLTGANLSGANLTGATHTGAIFKDAITGGCTGCP